MSLITFDIKFKNKVDNQSGQITQRERTTTTKVKDMW